MLIRSSCLTVLLPLSSKLNEDTKPSSSKWVEEKLGIELRGYTYRIGITSFKDFDYE
jgi:hypothetical protein